MTDRRYELIIAPTARKQLAEDVFSFNNSRFRPGGLCIMGCKEQAMEAKTFTPVVSPINHVSPSSFPRRRAFTLVELLVVIGIIAVLISILIPAFGRARQSAISVQCMSNMKQVGQAALMYAVQYKGWYPPIRRRTPKEVRPMKSSSTTPTAPPIAMK